MTYAPLANNPSEAIAAVVSGDASGLSVATSGSTGAPRDVLLSIRAIRASTFATIGRLGGPGSWLLALPTDRIGGALVAIRAGLTGQKLTTMPPGRFTAEAFATAAAEVPAGRRYVSLVPTQVVRLMASDLGRDALALFDAVLVGGAAFGDGERPANVIETYGMTETTGGCVYDGDPLNGVEVAIADDDRILISGATLADGYADGDTSAWVSYDGVPWLRTGDLGRWHSGRLEVLGRADDVIISGAHKVHPVMVERAIAALDHSPQAIIVGVDDPEWGKRVVAVMEAPAADHPLPDAPGLREALRDALPPYALPRDTVLTRSLPRTAGGKIDRSAAAILASQSLARGE
ncbi:AMP-binding protein [Demequina aurantiaca]|uniref:AMP-binding protein n=1 Tax=Demequina aurantiaca TaxID=676200 RepID=UPI000A019EA9|nr:AMP-binding protein [Demequina aurantiaca]